MKRGQNAAQPLDIFVCAPIAKVNVKRDTCNSVRQSGYSANDHELNALLAESDQDRFDLSRPHALS